MFMFIILSTTIFITFIMSLEIMSVTFLSFPNICVLLLISIYVCMPNMDDFDDFHHFLPWFVLCFLCIFMYMLIIVCFHFDHHLSCLCICCFFYSSSLVCCNKPLFLFVLPLNPASASFNTFFWFSELAQYKILHFFYYPTFCFLFACILLMFLSDPYLIILFHTSIFMFVSLTFLVSSPNWFLTFLLFFFSP